MTKEVTPKKKYVIAVALPNMPDRGEIFLDEHPARLRSPQDAVAMGIITVYQHLALIDTRDVLATCSLARSHRDEG